MLKLFKNPDEMKGILAKVLQKKLGQDSDLTQTLVELVEATGPDGQSNGAQIFSAGVAGIADLYP